MIYLDIVTMHTPAERITCRGALRLFEQRTEERQYLRVKDDRFPGEELLVPLESLEDEWGEAGEANRAADDSLRLGQAPLLGQVNS